MEPCSLEEQEDIALILQTAIRRLDVKTKEGRLGFIIITSIIYHIGGDATNLLTEQIVALLMYRDIRIIDMEKTQSSCALVLLSLEPPQYSLSSPAQFLADFGMTNFNCDLREDLGAAIIWKAGYRVLRSPDHEAVIVEEALTRFYGPSTVAALNKRN